MTNFKCDKYGYIGMNKLTKGFMMRKMHNSQVEDCYYIKSKHLLKVQIQMGS